MAVAELSGYEVGKVAGAGIVTDGLGCIGGIGAVLLSEGAYAIVGGVSALGSCISYVDGLYSNISGSSQYSSGGYGTGWSYSQSGNSNYSPYGGSSYSSSD